MASDPPSGKFRRPGGSGDDPPSPRHTDYPREVTRPGPHVDLDATEDDGCPAPVTPVDVMADAALAMSDTARAIAAHAISRDEAAGIRMRLANLETWRAGDVDPWRLRLTGVADTNGRMGRMDATVAELRKDLGTSEERRKEREAVASLRGDRKRVVAIITAAAVALGGGIYTIRDRYDAAVEARGADAQWRRSVDENFRTLFGLFGLRVPVTATDPGSKP